MIDRAFARVPVVRAKLAILATLLVTAWLTYRLADVQIRQSATLSRLALSQHSETVDDFAKRGSILDRDGTVLVRSLPSESVYAVPTSIDADDVPGIAAKLSPILGYPPDRLEAALRERTPFRYLKRKIPHSVAERVEALGIDGIGLKPEETGLRYAPSGRLASTVLGFVGTDENGLAGLEYSFDDYLRGTPGKTRVEADEFGRAIPFGDSTVVERAVPGKTLVLTLDSYVQFEAEHLIGNAMKTWHAKSATAIVMDVHTGEILAMANAPDFDPNHFAAAPENAWRNRAVADAYEPGSTFKLITAAAALESGKVTMATRFPARDQINVGGHTIHNAEDGFMAGSSSTETLQDIVAYSHNVGAAEVGMRIGKSTLYAMIRKFGFGDYTHIEVDGENTGIVPPTDEWSDSSVATISFGHGISTTPIALARAYAAIANGGILMRPRLVHALEDADGKTIYTYGPEIEQRAISEATAAKLRQILRAVVVYGTGNPSARTPGYTTAGKTGTAQVVENGRYEPGEYIGSFIGYVPADAPRYVILVKIERPRGAYYGGVVAAPIFAQLARTVMLHDDIMPSAPPRLVRRPPAPKVRR
ncbi:MAG TPA: penicillin-binding protein 2 [Candidatus Lustribacter sp.]|jgi:stage V sporulation protein D (sporulation-specific penicillin-binding protein)|nr:penicillin-binding protein 2 [Candidatus Lustribacter sp.]